MDKHWPVLNGWSGRLEWRWLSDYLTHSKVINFFRHPNPRPHGYNWLGFELCDFLGLQQLCFTDPRITLSPLFRLNCLNRLDTAPVLDQALHCLGQWMLSAFSDFKHHFLTVCNIFLFFTIQAIQCERMCWVLSVITSVCLWLAPIVNEQASTQNIRVWRARKNYRW